MSFLYSCFKFISGLFVILAILWLAGLLSYTVSVHSVQPERTGLRTDAIIVLTGGSDRIHTGLDLWADGLAPELFITGVYHKHNRQSIMQQWDNAEKPLPFCCLTLGYDATTTVENAVEAHDWIADNHIRSVRLVTARYHMPRAALEFKATMPDTEIYLHPVMHGYRGVEEEFFWKLVFTEYHKYIWRNFQIMSGYKGEPWAS